MSSFYDLASLVMIPSGKKSGKLYSQKPLSTDGQLDFTRASTATRIGSDGLIEKTRTNLLLQSNTFNTTWSAVSASVTGGQSGYDGSSDAWKLESTSSGVSGSVRQSVNQSGVGNLSVYAKVGNVNFLALYVASTSGAFNLWADLSSGTIGTATNDIDSNITSVGGGWYRISITGLNPNQRVDIYPANADGSYITASGENIYIQDAQLEQGLVATSYIETTTAAVSVGSVDNMPRLNYTPGSATSCPSLLLEPQRTNLIPYSEYLGGSAWTKANLNITDNATTSPEGVSNAAQLTESASGSSLRAVFEQFTPSLGTYTFSGFLKQGSLQYSGIRAIVNGGANRFFVNVDLSTGTITDTDIVGSGVTWTYDIEDYGNGWYRVWISGEHSIAGFVDLTYALSNSANPTYTSVLPVYTGTGSDYIYVYGAQLEAGSYATSYIPTFGATVTRVKDACSKTSVSGLIGQTEGTIYGEVKNIPNNDTAFLAPTLSDGTLNNSLYILRYTSGGVEYVEIAVRSGGVLGVDQRVALSVTDGDKFAFAYKQNDFVVYRNGVQILSDTSGNVSAMSNIYLGQNYNGSATTTGDFEQTLLFKTRLSNTQLADLTSIDS